MGSVVIRDVEKLATLLAVLMREGIRFEVTENGSGGFFVDLLGH